MRCRQRGCARDCSVTLVRQCGSRATSCMSDTRFGRSDIWITTATDRAIRFVSLQGGFRYTDFQSRVWTACGYAICVMRTARIDMLMVREMDAHVCDIRHASDRDTGRWWIRARYARLRRAVVQRLVCRHGRLDDSLSRELPGYAHGLRVMLRRYAWRQYAVAHAYASRCFVLVLRQFGWIAYVDRYADRTYAAAMRARRISTFG